MKNDHSIPTLFVDVGGVLLNDGWDHLARKRAAKHFGIKWTEMEIRHSLTFELHEQGRLTFENYLDLVVFYEKRAFTRTQFRNFMCDQSQPFPSMIGLVKEIKKTYGLKVVVVSNESRELNTYRIKHFQLGDFVDFFVSSCFVGLRKPDSEFFRLALDLSQARPEQVIYLENTPMFIGIAEALGIRSILHESYDSTSKQLAALGIKNSGEVIHANT
jgi:putative hydrolase of the HAD superfamily